MAERCYAVLETRGVLEVAGTDRVAFLQGLVSNDVSKAADDRALYAALLTAHGKYLFDFFIVASGDALYLDAEAARLAELEKRLKIYKLRSKVTLGDASDRFLLAAAWGDGAAALLGVAEEPGAARPFAGGVTYADPRLAALGLRLLLPRASAGALAAAGFAQVDAALYDRHRLALGVPDGSRDLEIEKSILLEAGFDELNGVDWQKGCYMGQELTARTKYRALIKKRLVPVTVEGPLPGPGTPIEIDGAEAGEMRSGRDGQALALLRLDAMEKAAAGAALTAGSARLHPRKPDWARF